jgi:hypothetical protein
MQDHKVRERLHIKAGQEKGKAHAFPPHDHDAVTHHHGHSHVVHFREPGERDDWKHLTVTHEHEHTHAAESHLHTPHEDLQVEHVHEAHVHDHST